MIGPRNDPNNGGIGFLFDLSWATTTRIPVES